MGPASTPNLIRQLITAICGVTLVAAFLDPLLLKYAGFGLQSLLSLSAQSIYSLFLWQPFSYLFVLQSMGTLSFGLIISLFFQMFILWMMGSHIVDRFGSWSFIKLYFGAGICAALLTLPIYASSPFMSPYAGPTASLYAIFVVWALMHQDSQILLFFIIPVKTKWLLVGGLGASLLVFISNESVLSLIMLITGTLFGYLFATFFKGFSSPYPFMSKIDQFFIDLGDRVRSPDRWRRKGPKIFDFKTGEPVESDEEFLDRILSKISKSGKESLTKKEKTRLDEISLKKKK